MVTCHACRRIAAGATRAGASPQGYGRCMRFSRRGKSLPPEVAGRVSGKVLATSRLQGGGWVVLTSTRFIIAGTRANDLQRPWHMVDRGEWTSDGNRIQVTWVDGQQPTELSLERDDRELAAVFRELVESSLVHSEVERLPGGGILRGTIRRDENGELFSQVSVTGVVREDHDLHERAQELESRVRAQVGLPS